MNPERVCYGCFAEKEPGIPCPHCGFYEGDEQPYLALPLGTILNGRYLVGKVLGIGGFGITYLGYDLTLEIKVAIKEYMPSALATRHSDHYSVVLTGGGWRRITDMVWSAFWMKRRYLPSCKALPISYRYRTISRRTARPIS